MSRIAGVVSTSDEKIGEKSFSDLFEVSWGDVIGEKNIWSDGNAVLGHLGLGHVNPFKQPVQNQNYESLIYCGKIVDYDAASNQLSKKGDIGVKNNIEITNLHAILASERYDLLSSFNGVFSVALWQPKRNRLTIANDRLGFRPLYYAHDSAGQKFIFSSDLRGVAAITSNKKINWQAASTFLHFGHHLGESTWFEGIYVLPPGSVIVFENGETKIKKYWNVSKISIDYKLSPDQAIDGIIETFRTSIRRRHKSSNMKEVVFLSGGIDSRRIAAELSNQNVRYDTYTTRGFNNTEANQYFAKIVSKRLDVSNFFVNLPKNNFLSEYWPKSNSFLDYETNLHQWMLPLVESFDSFSGYNYDGIGGDILMNGVLRSSIFANLGKDANLNNFTADQLACQVVGKPYDYSFLNPEIQNNISHEHVVSSVAAELNKFDDNENRLTYFFLLNRTRRSIVLSPMRLIARRFECYLPYLDNEFFDFVSSIPMELKVGIQLRRNSLDKAYPVLCGIDNTNYKVKKYRDNKADDINYEKQRKVFLLNCIKHFYIENNWVFSNRRVLPLLLKDLLLRFSKKDHVSQVFKTSNEVFYEFLCSDLNKANNHIP